MEKGKGFDMDKVPDEQLMVNYKNGDASVMEEIVARYTNPIYRFAFRLSKNAMEAQDITQEVFLRLHRSKSEYMPSGKFSTWLFGIAHNLCVTKLRKSKWLAAWPVKKNDPELLMDFESPDPSPREQAAEVETASIVKDSIQSLPFLQKEALILREYENLNYKEIARILGKPLGTVKILIHRARQALKKKLLPYIEEGGLR